MTRRSKDKKSAPAADGIVGFPQSKTKPAGYQANFRDLGPSETARRYGHVQPNLKGHWCSRCKGIWWGFVGEVECPECGNRNG